MNRRDFTRSLAAFSLAPLVPVASVAKALPSSATTVGSGSALNFINAWSTHYVRKTGSCSPEQLAKHFGLVPETAQIVTNGLIERGVLAAPNALGVSRAINPLATTLAKAPKPSPSKLLEQFQEASDATSLETESISEPNCDTDTELADPNSVTPTPNS